MVPNNGNNGTDYDVSFASGNLTQDIVDGVTINTLYMSGGSLILANPLTLEVGLQFTGGSITSGTLNVAGSSSQTAQMTVNGTTINNSGNYDIALVSGNVFSGGGSTFNNSGTLTGQSLDGTVTFNMLLNNSGTVSAEEGTFSLTGGGTSSGVFSASPDAVLELGGNFSFTEGAVFAGAGTIVIDNGTTTSIAGMISNSGNILLNSSNNVADLVLSGDVTLAGGGTLNLINYDRVYGLSLIHI